MEDAKFEGRYGSLNTLIRDYQLYTEEQRTKIKELLLTYPDSIFSLSGTIERAAQLVTTRSRFPVTKIKRWDVIYCREGSETPHYHIVIKVVKDKVYCLSITSNKAPFAELEITNSRQLHGYICSFPTVISLENAKNSFVFIYEGSKKEICSILKTIKEQINSVLK